jgi:hypothetical protein
MSYKKFQNSDLLYNTIKAKPRFEIKIWGGKAVVNAGVGEAVLNNLQTSPPVAGSSVCDIQLDFSCPDNSFYIGVI